MLASPADATPVEFGASIYSTLQLTAIPCGAECLFQTLDETGVAWDLTGEASGPGYSIDFPNAELFALPLGTNTIYGIGGGGAEDTISIPGLCPSNGVACGTPQYYSMTLANQLTNNLLSMIWDWNGISVGFSLNVDPAFITDLVPATGTPVDGVNYVDLSVASACYDLASPSGCATPVPAPTALECLAIGGLGLALALRRRTMHGRRQA